MKRLPKIDRVTFELTLPSNGEIIRCQAFSTREEKLLMYAKESSNPVDAIFNVKKVVEQCIIDEDVDINRLSVCDVEYIMLNLRSQSIDNVVKFRVIDFETKEPVDMTLNLADAKIVKSEIKDANKFEIGDGTYHLEMRYPNIDDYVDIMRATMKVGEEEATLAQIEAKYRVMANCMVRLLSDDEIHNFEDFSPEDIDDFLNDLSQVDVDKIEAFFSTVPKLRYEIPYTNSLGNNHTYVIEGLRSFFI